MKKYALILAALLISSSASALTMVDDFAAVEVQQANGVNGTADQNVVGLMVRKNLLSNLAADFSINQTNNGGSPDTLASTRDEFGLIGNYKTGTIFTPYARVAIGQKYKSNDNFTYWSAEPGVAIATIPNLTIAVSYRYRTALADNKLDTTETGRIGAYYNLTDKTTIYTRFDRMRGDANQNIYAVGVMHGF